MKQSNSWIYDVLLVAVLLMGAYFRLVGLNWDENQHLHPDERFLSMVTSSLVPSKNLVEYFNTTTSTMNPHNQGYGFFVYGTLPLFMVRFIAEAINQTGYNELTLVGRQVSTLMDLITVFLVYLIARRLWRNLPLAVMASAFYALAVLPIQLSHFYTVDTFTNTFVCAAVYFAVSVMTGELPKGDVFDQIHWQQILKIALRIMLPFALFGVSLGFALASKVSAIPVAVMVVIAVLVQLYKVAPRNRYFWSTVFLINLIVAAIISILVFRFCQPYAFKGPGFFGIIPNERWIANLNELSNQSAGDVDFPPALQWARRPLSFAWSNMVVWGMGLPMGLLAWAGFLWMGWKITRGSWKEYILIWGWSAFYFTWQSLNWTRSMRYQLFVYPTLAILAAWLIYEMLRTKSNPDMANRERLKFSWRYFLAVGLAGIVLLSTAGWAYAFTRIYTRPHTRVDASRWIYQNIPAAINLVGVSGERQYNQPVSFRSGMNLVYGRPIIMAFQPRREGLLDFINFSHISDARGNAQLKTLVVRVSETKDPANLSAYALTAEPFRVEGDPRGRSYKLYFTPQVVLNPLKQYYLFIEVNDPSASLNIAGPMALGIRNPGGIVHQELLDPVETIKRERPYLVNFVASQNTEINQIYLHHVVDWERTGDQKKLRVTLKSNRQERNNAVNAEVKDSFIPLVEEMRGQSFSAQFDQPIKLVKNEMYTLTIEMIEGTGSIAIYGSRQANESTWDDVLPLGVDGINPYDYTSGVFRSDLNFEMYLDDNVEKRERFLTILNQADYIFISSNRQWGTTVRVPERYPLTRLFYRNLIGCPPDKDIIWCYSVAEPGQFQGNLGFDLLKTFQSDPNLGSLRFNTQFAEEAFTVYDHPKVLIFKKNQNYSHDFAASLFDQVDLSQAIHLTPRKAADSPGTLLLPEELKAIQRQGGTWSEIFNRDSLVNRYHWLGLMVWYLSILLLGWIVFPFVRLALAGLADRGYPVARLVGLLLLALITWLLGSIGIPFQRETITLVLFGLFIVNGVIAWYTKEELLTDIKQRWKSIAIVELVALSFFLISLIIRLGNPDLWHPFKGGEKPMDFAYLNAVIKSTVFPPYDPWFAGGYINYYYYGFVVVGVLVKWLGIIPSVAYNLILPTLFSLVALTAFCIGSNLQVLAKSLKANEENSKLLDLTGGIGSAIAVLILGNLGTLRMIWHGLQRLGYGGSIDELNFVQRWIYTFDGLSKLIGGARMPFYPGDWYWIPSRVYPGEPITEFPFFTFLYADLHAHMIALPVTLLVIVWAVSVVSGRWYWVADKTRYRYLGRVINLVFAGVVIGALYPTNTWDYYPYLVLALAALSYSIIRYGSLPSYWVFEKNWIWGKVGIAVFLSLGVYGLTRLLYLPFYQWFGQGYSEIGLWEGAKSPFWSYITHWGLFLFLIVSWLAWETIEWMATTPVSALRKVVKYQYFIQGGVVLFIALLTWLFLSEVDIGWLAVPIAVWSGVLIFRPRFSDVKRFVLFMIGTGMMLTLLVELVVLKGDIGRMNTVFKFYLQAWTLLSLSAAAGLVWLIPAVEQKWQSTWKVIWQTGLTLLIAITLLFPVLGTIDKIQDRMSVLAPKTLDGNTYMNFAKYNDQGRELILAEDYAAIKWLQDHVVGSPVILEGYTPEYRLGARISINTGLPAVIGWNWHQRQQRAVVNSDWVTQRVDEVNRVYNSRDKSEVMKFLSKYDVRYIIVGQVEQAYYSSQGLEKFSAWNGDLWDEVFRTGQTVIFKVRQSIMENNR